MNNNCVFTFTDADFARVAASSAIDDFGWSWGDFTFNGKELTILDKEKFEQFQDHVQTLYSDWLVS